MSFLEGITAFFAAISRAFDFFKPSTEPSVVSQPAPVVEPVGPKPELFNEYVLKSVELLNAKYGKLGYDINSELTHDVAYGKYGLIKKKYKGKVNEAPNYGKTMCVAAAMEVILEAMNIYASETKDQSVFDFLPKRSWEGYTINDIKAHIWVNPKPPFKAYGTASALASFGMGEMCKFKDLKPGGFIGLNRTGGSGHAVVFICFLDIHGNEFVEYHEGVVGFKYFSSQGSSVVGAGGLDYRYAYFAPHQPAAFTDGRRRDLGVIKSDNQMYLNCGHMWHPSRWDKSVRPGVNKLVAFVGPKTKFDVSKYGTGNVIIS